MPPRLPPEYEQAYFNDTTVTINAIEVHQSEEALTHAAADFSQVVYPTDHSLWSGNPQCNAQSPRASARPGHRGGGVVDRIEALPPHVPSGPSPVDDPMSLDALMSF
jgi:hypothetical protein